MIKKNKKKKSNLEEQHPSLNGYTPVEPIPDGYKLVMVSYPNMEGFAVEWLEKESKKAA